MIPEQRKGESKREYVGRVIASLPLGTTFTAHQMARAIHGGRFLRSISAHQIASFMKAMDEAVEIVGRNAEGFIYRVKGRYDAALR